MADNDFVARAKANTQKYTENAATNPGALVENDFVKRAKKRAAEVVAQTSTPDDPMVKAFEGYSKNLGNPEYQRGIEETLAPLRQRVDEAQPKDVFGQPKGYGSAGLSVGPEASFDEAAGKTRFKPEDLPGQAVNFVGEMFFNAASLPYSTANMLGSVLKEGSRYNVESPDAFPRSVATPEEKQATADAGAAFLKNVEGGGLIIPGGIAKGLLGKAASPLLQKVLTYGPIAAMARPMVDLGVKVVQDPVRTFNTDPFSTAMMGLGALKSAAAGGEIAGRAIQKARGVPERPVGVIREPGKPDVTVDRAPQGASATLMDVILGRRESKEKLPEWLIGDVPDAGFRDIVQPVSPQKAVPSRGDVIKSKLPQGLVESWETPNETQARLQRAAGITSADMPTVPGLDLARLNEIRSKLTTVPETAKSVVDVLRQFDPEVQSIREGVKESGAKVSELLSDEFTRANVGKPMLGEQVQGQKIGGTTFGVDSGVPYASTVYPKSAYHMATERQTPFISWLDEARGRTASGKEVPEMPLNPSQGEGRVSLQFKNFEAQAKDAADRAKMAKTTHDAALAAMQKSPPKTRGEAHVAETGLRAMQHEAERAQSSAIAAEDIARRWKEAEATGAPALAKEYVETVMPIAARILGRALQGSETAAVDILFNRLLNPEAAPKKGKGARFAKTETGTNPETMVSKLTETNAPGTMKSAQGGMHAVLTDIIHDLSFAENIKGIFDSMPKPGEYTGPTRPISFEALRSDAGTRSIIREMGRASDSGWFPKDWATRGAIEKVAIPEAHANLIEYIAGMPDNVRRAGRQVAAAASEGGKALEDFVTKKLGRNQTIATIEKALNIPYRLLRNSAIALNWSTGVGNMTSGFALGEMAAAKHGTPSPMVNPVSYAALGKKVSADIARGNFARKLATDTMAKKDVTLLDTMNALVPEPTRLAELPGPRVGGHPVGPTVHGMTVEAVQEFRRAAAAAFESFREGEKQARKLGVAGLTKGIFKGAEAAFDRMLESYQKRPETVYEMGLRSDLIHRIILTRDLLNKGYSFNDAIRIVKEAHLNYGNTNAFTRGISRWFIPFFAFSAKATPVVAKYVAQHPWRALFWSMASKAADLGGAMAAGMTEDEWKKEKERRGFRHKMAYVTGPESEINFSRTAPMFWGANVAIDAADQAMRGMPFLDSVGYAMGRNMGIPALEVASQIQTGRDPKTGERSVDPADLAWDIGKKYLIPPYIRSFGEILDRQGRNLMKDKDIRDKGGFRVPLSQDLLNIVTGFREKGVNLPRENKRAQGAQERYMNIDKGALDREKREAIERNDWDAVIEIDKELLNLRMSR